MEPIILASSSPRRQEILKSLKIPFRVIMPNIDETISSMLKGEEIPVWAHAVAVADCFDALTSKRVYKDKFELEKAHKMIVDGECGKFSDDIMKCFVLAKDELFQAYNEIH